MRRVTQAYAACALLGALGACVGEAAPAGGTSGTPTGPTTAGRLDHVRLTGVPDSAWAGDSLVVTADALTAAGQPVADATLAWTLADTAAATLTANGTTTGSTAVVRLRRAGALGLTVSASAPATSVGGAASATATRTVRVRESLEPVALARLILSPRALAARYGAWTPVTATVTDALGNVADVPVTWTPIPHDGERFAGTAPVQVTVPTVPGGSPAPTRTAQVMGVYPTTTRIVATAQPTTAGGQPVSDTLTLRVLDRPAAGLAASAWAAVMLPAATQTLAVAATDSAGRTTTLPDGLTYVSSNPGVVAVDAAGQFTAVSAGQVTITVSAPPGQTVYGSQALRATTALTVVTTAPFAIDVRLVGAGASGGYGAQVQRAAARAVDRWRTLVTRGGGETMVSLAAGTCGDASPAVNETVPSLLVFVELTAFGRGANAGVLSGPAAVAGPCVVRSGATGLPVVGRILVDTTKLVGQSDDGIATVMTHELGHVLGFGTLWMGPRADALVTGIGASDPRYVGQNGVAAWHAAGGARVGGAGVPLENGGIGANGHWRVAAFGNELMLVAVDSPTGAAPASAVTLGALADFGYAVMTADADPYQVPSTATASRASTASGVSDHADAIQPTLAAGLDGRVHALTTADVPGRLAVPRLFEGRARAGGRAVPPHPRP